MTLRCVNGIIKCVNSLTPVLYYNVKFSVVSSVKKEVISAEFVNSDSHMDPLVLETLDFAQ